MWNNLLPHGSRTVELYSSIGLLIVAILLFTGLAPVPEQLLALDSRYVWNTCLAILGVLQLYSLFYYPRLESLRVLTGWLAGCFWLWAGISSSAATPDIADIASVVLGLANFYGFIINFNSLHRSWQNSP